MCANNLENPLSSRSISTSFYLPWLIGLLVGLLYLLTLAPGVLWQDSGMFQVHIWQSDLRGRLGLALAHPLYIVLARAFTWIIPGDFAWRVNLFSAVCSAGAIALFFASLVRLTRLIWPALVAVALLALSHTFWTHAVIAEVYGLYALLLSLEMYLLVRYHQSTSPRKAWWLVSLFLVNGLNISNHLLALLHLPAYVIYTLLQVRARRIRISRLVFMLLALSIGAGLYEAMIIVQISRGSGFVDTVKSALFGIHWQNHVIGRIPDLTTLAKCLGYFLLNFPTPLLLLAPAGIYFALRDSRVRSVAAVWFGICTVAFIFALRYRVPDQYVFFFPCYIFTVVFIGLAVSRIGSAQPSKAFLSNKIVVLALALLPALIYELVPVVIARVEFLAHIADQALLVGGPVPGRDTYAYFLRPRKNADRSAEVFALAALELAQPDGLIIADNTTRNPIIYLQQVRGFYTGVYLAQGDDLQAGKEAKPNLAAVDRCLASGRKVFIVSPSRQSVLAEQLRAQGRFRLIPKYPLYEVQLLDLPPS